MTTEIKPCPSCNGPNSVVEPAATAARPLAAGYYVRCSHCCVRGPCASTPEESVEWWNKLPRRDDVPVAVAVPEDTLHDKYVRAAITGIMAHYGTKETPDYVIGEARDVADAAMKARQA